MVLSLSIEVEKLITFVRCLRLVICLSRWFVTALGNAFVMSRKIVVTTFWLCYTPLMWCVRYSSELVVVLLVGP